MIGSLYFARKRKLCLALFPASAASYKYARGAKLFGVGNFGYKFINGIKRSRNTEETV